MSPTYVVEEKLGKGGFGQVYIGRRKTPSNATEGADANKASCPSSIPTLLAVQIIVFALSFHCTNVFFSCLSQLYERVNVMVAHRDSHTPQILMQHVLTTDYETTLKYKLYNVTQLHVNISCPGCQLVTKT